MLVYIDETRKVYAYNPFISEEQAQQYLDSRSVWVEGEIPKHYENEEVYVTTENTFAIREREETDPVEPEPTNDVTWDIMAAAINEGVNEV